MDCHKDKTRVCDSQCPRFIPGKPEQQIPDQCFDNIATQYLTKLCKTGIDMLGTMVEKAVKDGK